MKSILILLAICFCICPSFAQQKIIATPTTLVKKMVPIVPTKELKRQLDRNFKRKKYKAVLPIADTLLKRKSKDEDVFYKKLASKIMLKMDNSAIDDVKKWYKNKDTAASLIAYLPYQFDFKSLKRSPMLYSKAAMAWGPKNGITYILHGVELAEQKKMEEAVAYSKKGYDMLPPKIKKDFFSAYAQVYFDADRKEEAYKMLYDEITGGNKSEKNINDYFNFFYKDKRYQDGIDKATEFIKNDSIVEYFSNRALFYNDLGNTEKACEDATTLKEKFEQYDYWLKRFGCPQVMADVVPNKNRTYIYEVVFQGNTYDFRVSNPIVDMKNGINFKFKMTGDVGINGIVDIDKYAIDTAHAQMNKFSKENINLTDATSVWVSNAVFNDIKTKGETVINASFFYGNQLFELVPEDNPYYSIVVDDADKYIKCIKITTPDGNQEIWINDDPKNPIILKLKTDFTIELKQIL